MSRVNPLYLAMLLVVLILLLVFKIGSARDDLADAKESVKQTAKVAVELSGLKKVYAKKGGSTGLNFKSVVKTKTKSSLTLSAKEIDIKKLESLMSRVLNGSYNITTLKIKKISDTKASLYLEIK